MSASDPSAERELLTWGDQSLGDLDAPLEAKEAAIICLESGVNRRVLRKLLRRQSLGRDPVVLEDLSNNVAEDLPATLLLVVVITVMLVAREGRLRLEKGGDTGKRRLGSELS